MYEPISHPFPIKVYKIIAIVITSCLLQSCSSKIETPGPDPETYLKQVSASLLQAEILFGERSDIEKLRQAVSTLDATRNPDLRNFELEWRFAKYSYFLGKAEQTEADAVEAFESGRDAALIAAHIKPDEPDGHFWYAANLGELSRISPVTVGLRSVDDIRGSMEKVITIEPTYQNGSAFDALGQLEMATRTLAGGSTEEAAEYFEKGLTLSPDNANLRLHLAEACLALRKLADAKKHLNALIASKPDPQYVHEHMQAVEKGRSLLAKNF